MKRQQEDEGQEVRTGQVDVAKLEETKHQTTVEEQDEYQVWKETSSGETNRKSSQHTESE